jgi:predicted ATPase
MIRSIQISKLRGIREGKLDDLTPLTVLVGPNSSGKSTVLDAILIGASPTPAEALGRAVEHRSRIINGARWLLWRAGEDGGARIVAKSAAGRSRECSITLGSVARSEAEQTELELKVLAGGYSAKAVLSYAPSTNDYLCRTDFDVNQLKLAGVSAVRFVEPWTIGVVKQLVELYSDAKQLGRIESVNAGVREVLPDVKTIEVLVESGVPLLHLERGNRSLQVGAEGDGVQSVLRLALELASRPGGTILLEEPETHQHPATLVTTAKVIAAAVRSGVQIILATHSLELIDALVAALGEDPTELAKLSVVSLRLDDGRLVSSRLDGEQVARSRENLAMELR